jgi:hypothetical protein
MRANMRAAAIWATTWVAPGIGLVVLAMGAWAQGPPPPGRGRGWFGPDGGPGARFLGGEPGMPGRVVKNAPFTGDLITETTQTLSDGNRIHQTATAHMVRDSEGRTRREQSLSGLGALGSPSGNAQAIFIDDPVAGVNYALNPKNHTATKSAVMPRGRGGRSGTPPNGGFRGANRPEQDAKTEVLGRQTVEGLPADGTRVTVTIPAGRMGNDLPIQVVTERWYSPDLQMNISTKRTDPRTGETVTKLTNVSRAEPAHSLFEAPVDYKVSDYSRGQKQ